jgi:hypothetical protein
MATLETRLANLITAIGADIKTVGSLTSLVTTVKTSVVAAVNEVHGKLNNPDFLPPKTTITMSKTGTTWPGVTTARGDVVFIWMGADPSPPIVASRTLNQPGMLSGVDIRVVV